MPAPYATSSSDEASPAVVEQHDVKLLGSVVLTGAARPGDHRYVVREPLPGGAMRLRQLGHDGGLRPRRLAATPEHDDQRRDRGQSHDNGHNREERQHLDHRVTLCDSQAA